MEHFHEQGHTSFETIGIDGSGVYVEDLQNTLQKESSNDHRLLVTVNDQRFMCSDENFLDEALAIGKFLQEHPKVSMGVHGQNTMNAAIFAGGAQAPKNIAVRDLKTDESVSHTIFAKRGSGEEPGGMSGGPGD